MDPQRGDDQLTEAQALKAWLRDLQGINGVESFKSRVLNRKKGEMEERQHVWVFTGVSRHNEDETRNTKAATLKNSNKEFTSAQIQEAQNKVFSFAAWWRLVLCTEPSVISHSLPFWVRLVVSETQCGPCLHGWTS